MSGAGIPRKEQLSWSLPQIPASLCSQGQFASKGNLDAQDFQRSLFIPAKDPQCRMRLLS